MMPYGQQPGFTQLPVPYASAIPVGPSGSIARRVTINGTVPSAANRFSVNLQCGPNTHPLRDDIAIHLQFRFDAQVPYVARNHLQSQVWGVEESHGFLSFGRGQPFEMHIDTDHDRFKIFLNNLHFTEFAHRLPAQRISYLTIDGDVALTAVRFDGQVPMTPSMVGGPPYHQQPVGFVNPPMPGGVGVAPPYPMQAGVGMPGVGVHGLNPGMPGHGAPVYPGYPVSPSSHGHHSGHSGGYHSTSHAIPMAAAGVGTGLVAGALLHGANKKAMKKQKKLMKKAMKPHKYSHKFKHKHHGFGGHHHHHKSGSSSSSSSSSSD